MSGDLLTVLLAMLVPAGVSLGLGLHWLSRRWRPERERQEQRDSADAQVEEATRAAAGSRGAYRDAPAVERSAKAPDTATVTAQEGPNVRTLLDVVQAWERRMRDLGYDEHASVWLRVDEASASSRKAGFHLHSELLTWSEHEDGKWGVYLVGDYLGSGSWIGRRKRDSGTGLQLPLIVAALPRLYEACRGASVERDAQVLTAREHIGKMQPPPRKAGAK